MLKIDYEKDSVETICLKQLVNRLLTGGNLSDSWLMQASAVVQKAGYYGMALRLNEIRLHAEQILDLLTPNPERDALMMRLLEEDR